MNGSFPARGTRSGNWGNGWRRVRFAANARGSATLRSAAFADRSQPSVRAE